jgi:hypothetical protein
LITKLVTKPAEKEMISEAIGEVMVIKHTRTPAAMKMKCRQIK